MTMQHHKLISYIGRHKRAPFWTWTCQCGHKGTATSKANVRQAHVDHIHNTDEPVGLTDLLTF